MFEETFLISGASITPLILYWSSALVSNSTSEVKSINMIESDGKLGQGKVFFPPNSFFALGYSDKHSIWWGYCIHPEYFCNMSVHF